MREETEHSNERVRGGGDLLETATLEPWQEIVGNLEHVSHNEHLLEVRMRTKSGLMRLLFTMDSPGAKQVRDILLNLPRGCRAGILRTDSTVSPILIRTVLEP